MTAPTVPVVDTAAVGDRFRAVVQQLVDRAVRTGVNAYAALDTLPRREQFRIVSEIFPNLMDQVLNGTGEITAQLVAEQLDAAARVTGIAVPDEFVPVAAPPPDPEALAATGRYALTQPVLSTTLDQVITSLVFAHVAATVGGIVEGLNAMLGTGTDAGGDAVPYARWMRHASANACGFCKMIATRHVGEHATFYRSRQAAERVVGRTSGLTVADRRAIAAGTMTREEALAMRETYSSAAAAKRAGVEVGDRKAARTRGSRDLGEKWHDKCRCTAILIPPGTRPKVAPYYEQWNDDYLAAREEGASSPNDIVNAMNRIERARQRELSGDADGGES